jgi:hypothetical protein
MNSRLPDGTCRRVSRALDRFGVPLATLIYIDHSPDDGQEECVVAALGLPEDLKYDVIKVLNRLLRRAFADKERFWRILPLGTMETGNLDLEGLRGMREWRFRDAEFTATFDEIELHERPVTSRLQLAPAYTTPEEADIIGDKAALGPCLDAA